MIISVSFSSDSSGELDILWHNGDSLSMNGAKIGIFKQSYHVSLGSFLKSKNCLGLESQIAFVFLSDFSDQSLEWKFSDEELSRFLELSDFSESNCAWSESVRFLDSTDVLLIGN